MSDTSKASSSNPTTSHPSISVESVSKLTPIIFNGDHNSFRSWKIQFLAACFLYKVKWCFERDAPTVALDGY
eukprot:Pgem_evm1s136